VRVWCLYIYIYIYIKCRDKTSDNITVNKYEIRNYVRNRLITQTMVNISTAVHCKI